MKMGEPNEDKMFEEKIRENVETEMRVGIEAEQGEGEMSDKDFDFVNSRQGSISLFIIQPEVVEPEHGFIHRSCFYEPRCP